MKYTARISFPAKNAMQSGKKRSGWVIDFISEDKRFVEPLMGWTGSAETATQVRLKFESKEAAIAYCEKKGLDYEVEEPNAPTFKPKSYATNFAFNRVRH